MKSCFIVFVFFLTSQFSYGQYEIAISRSNNHSCKKGEIEITRLLGIKNRVSLGLSILSNNGDQDRTFATFEKAFYATSNRERLGFKFCFSRDLPKIGGIDPFWFIDFRRAKGNTRGITYFVDKGTHGFFEHGPYIWMESYVGVGYRIEIKNNFSMFQKIGVGVLIANFVGDRTKIFLPEGYQWDYIARTIEFGIIKRL